MSTKAKTPDNREKRIMELLDCGDQKALTAFKLLKVRYVFDDELKLDRHLKFINLIYVKRIKLTKWSIANECNIGYRTSFRYRHDYLDLLEGCIDGTIDMNNIVDTIIDLIEKFILEKVS